MKDKTYRIFNKKRSEGKSLEGLIETNHPKQCNNLVTVANWKNWNNSFWIKIHTPKNTVIFDSGVIEDLAKIIQDVRKEK